MINRKSFFLMAFCLCSTVAFTQAVEKNIVYNAGLGPGIEGNIGLIGLCVTNEFSFQLTNRIAFHPSLNYFGTLRQFSEDDGLGYPGSPNADSHAGFFINAPIQFTLLKIKSFALGVSGGPSLEIGTSSFNTSSQFDFDTGQWVNHTWEVEYHRRVGYLTSLVAAWPHKRNENRSSSIIVSVYSFDNYYGYFLMTTYRFGFLLNKK